VVVDQAPSLQYGFRIVTADHRLKADKMFVFPDDIGSVLGHPLLALRLGATKEQLLHNFPALVTSF
jgi:hypothetical protein